MKLPQTRLTAWRHVRWRARIPRSSTSIFSEPEDFEAALSSEGITGLLITGNGKLRARLTDDEAAVIIVGYKTCVPEELRPLPLPSSITHDNVLYHGS